LASVVTALPAYWRLIQCLRRYYDNRNSAHPHLSNALKYVLSLSTIAISTAEKFSGQEYLIYLWAIFAFTTSVYSYLWDVMFDWGLFSNREYLRDELNFPKWFYYMAIVMNLFLRFTWVVLLAPNHWDWLAHANVVVYVLAVLEVCRRSVWVLLRMENEHSNNVGNYRATKELPMPFEILKRDSD
jgi:hypothetical protein